jgi:hypothetical protein
MKQAHPLQRLRLVEQPPPHVFLEQWFSFVLALENQGGTDIPDRSVSDVDGLTLRTNLQLNYGPMPRIGSCDATLAKLVSLMDKFNRNDVFHCRDSASFTLTINSSSFR